MTGFMLMKPTASDVLQSAMPKKAANLKRGIL